MRRNMPFVLFVLLLLAAFAPARGSTEAATVTRVSADAEPQDAAEGGESGGQARPEKDVARGVRSLVILVVVIGFLAWTRARRRRRMREAVRTVFGG